MPPLRRVKCCVSVSVHISVSVSCMEKLATANPGTQANPLNRCNISALQHDCFLQVRLHNIYQYTEPSLPS